MKFDKVIDQILVENKLKAEIPKEKIAKKHRITVQEVEKLLKIGTKVEKEHTRDHKTAQTIASHHIYEVRDYYEKLKKARL